MGYPLITFLFLQWQIDIGVYRVKQTEIWYFHLKMVLWKVHSAYYISFLFEKPHRAGHFTFKFHVGIDVLGDL